MPRIPKPKHAGFLSGGEVCELTGFCSKTLARARQKKVLIGELKTHSSGGKPFYYPIEGELGVISWLTKIGHSDALKKLNTNKR